jgi:hypothetical protein
MKNFVSSLLVVAAGATGSVIKFEGTDLSVCSIDYQSSATGLVTGCELTAPNLCYSNGVNCQSTDLSGHATKTELNSELNSVKLSIANLNRMVCPPPPPARAHALLPHSSQAHNPPSTIATAHRLRHAHRPVHTTLPRTKYTTRKASACTPLKARARSVRVLAIIV